MGTSSFAGNDIGGTGNDSTGQRLRPERQRYLSLLVAGTGKIPLRKALDIDKLQSL